MIRKAAIVCLCLTLTPLAASRERTITKEALVDKISGFWYGQIVGNYLGWPFENVYQEEPVPVLVDRLYTHRDQGAVRVNENDPRGFVPILLDLFDGAFTDDDTDIEFVTLHAVEKHGLDLTYPEITEMWKTHINRWIWVANRTARDLMSQGLEAPDTGKKENNENWFQIDPQLVNEIWSAFYPGMTRRASERAEWGARITNDDWGTHATVAYAVMYSAAFFESDVQKIIKLALEAIPPQGPFHEGMVDVIRWHQQDRDWRKTRQRIHEKYYRYKKGDYEAPFSPVSSLNNGLAGVMAILYGNGDFMKTTGIAVSAGYDCDNQGATCAGFAGVLQGAGAIPSELMLKMSNVREWTEPFNDRYLNHSRDQLPYENRLTDIIRRTAAIAENAILSNGGRKTTVDGQEAYVVSCDF